MKTKKGKKNAEKKRENTRNKLLLKK